MTNTLDLIITEVKENIYELEQELKFWWTRRVTM